MVLYILAVDHTTSKEQDPIRTPPRSDVRPGQYWAGGPPGNTKELTAFFCEFNCHPIVINRQLVVRADTVQTWQVGRQIVTPTHIHTHHTMTPPKHLIVNTVEIDRKIGEVAIWHPIVSNKRYIEHHSKPQQIVRQSLLSCLQHLDASQSSFGDAKLPININVYPLKAFVADCGMTSIDQLYSDASIKSTRR